MNKVRGATSIGTEIYASGSDPTFADRNAQNFQFGNVDPEVENRPEVESRSDANGTNQKTALKVYY